MSLTGSTGIGRAALSLNGPAKSANGSMEVAVIAIPGTFGFCDLESDSLDGTQAKLADVLHSYGSRAGKSKISGTGHVQKVTVAGREAAQAGVGGSDIIRVRARDRQWAADSKGISEEEKCVEIDQGTESIAAKKAESLNHRGFAAARI